MIYLLAYLSIGAAFSIYTPIVQMRHRARAKGWKDIPREKLETMTPREIELVKMSIEISKTPYRTWQVVLAGLLWPTQIIALIAAHFITARINRRAERYADRIIGALVCSCPGCKRNLVTTPLTDCIEAKDSDLVRFICGHCATGSDWDFSPPTPIFLREVKVVPLPRRDLSP